jgi:LacI family transcriptional regulator
VQGDSVADARRLVDHLLALGHTRIGMVTESDEVSTARDRRAGYVQALAAAGVEPDPKLVAVSSATDSRAARDAARRLFALPDPPTAIFAVNNIAVVGVFEAARDEGLRIPDDLALVCFDDIEHVARVYPFLTVMSQPAETFGTVATQLLLDRVASRRDEEPRTVLLPSKLVVRESCGARLKRAV